LGSDIWLAKVKIFLNLIHNVYSNCIQDKYQQIFLELKDIKNSKPENVMHMMSSLLHKIEKDMQAIKDGYLNFLEHYKTKYVVLSEDERIKVGLIAQIRKSESDPKKKFFISTANFYLGNSSKQFFGNCNTSRIREDVHKSVKDKPYAMLVFKR
jgi:hypothetical protein